MKRLRGAALATVLGAGFASMGLLDTSGGTLRIGGGNEATFFVLVAGAAIGAVVGATFLRDRPIALMGAIVGLAAGIWLRDNMTMSYVQPPAVFFLLFGLPILGGTVGFFIDRKN
jgi:hypothetical protein